MIPEPEVHADGAAPVEALSVDSPVELFRAADGSEFPPEHAILRSIAITSAVAQRNPRSRITSSPVLYDLGRGIRSTGAPMSLVSPGTTFGFLRGVHRPPPSLRSSMPIPTSVSSARRNKATRRHGRNHPSNMT